MRELQTALVSTQSRLTRSQQEGWVPCSQPTTNQGPFSFALQNQQPTKNCFHNKKSKNNQPRVFVLLCFAKSTTKVQFCRRPRSRPGAVDACLCCLWREAAQQCLQCREGAYPSTPKIAMLLLSMRRQRSNMIHVYTNPSAHIDTHKFIESHRLT